MVPDKSCPKVLIIILNWNNPSDTIECLNSILSLNYRPYNVMVIDNGSTGNSISDLKDWAIASNKEWILYDQSGLSFHGIWSSPFPNLFLMRTGVNLGYAGGNNRGLNASLALGADYAFVLNNDTTIHSECLKWLIDAAQTSANIAAVSGKILFYDDSSTIYAAGVDYIWGKGTHCVGRGESDNGQYDFRRFCDSLNGSAMLIKCRDVQEVGMFDESYFLAVEETDLCYRMRANGRLLLYEPKAKIFHKAGRTANQSSSTMLYYSRRNILRFIFQYKTKIEFFYFFVRFAFSNSIKCLKLATKGDVARIQAIGKAHFDFLCQKYGQRKLTFL